MGESSQRELVNDGRGGGVVGGGVGESGSVHGGGGVGVGTNPCFRYQKSRSGKQSLICGKLWIIISHFTMKC